MVNSYNGYISGTAVPKYGYAPEVKVKPQVQQEKKISKKENTKRFYKLFMIGLFAAVFTIVLRSTIISQMNNQIASLNSTLAKVEKEVQQSAVKLEAMTDLNTVQSVAVNELNMGTPQQHQIVELDLDMGNKTIAVQSGSDSSGNWLTSVWNFCMEYLY